MDDTTFTSDAAAAGMNRRMLLEQLAAIRSLMHGEDASDDDSSRDVIKEAMMGRKEQVAKNLSTEFLLTVLLDILLLRLLDEGGEGQATVPPTVSSNQQRLMDDAAAKKKKKKAAAKKKRRKRNKAAAKHKKTKLMSWLGGGMISLIMMMVAFSSIATPIFTLSLIHLGDGSGDANAKALPPSASTSLRQRDHGSNNAASTSSPGIISPLTAVVPPPIFSPPVDTAAVVVSVSSRHMKSDELRTSTCLDTPNWEDKWGYGCDAYERNNWCSTADNWAGFMGPATENCCYCGGGSHTFFPTTCTDAEGWFGYEGYNCGWYEVMDDPGCPRYGHILEEGAYYADWYYEGYQGTANDHCCHCKSAIVSTDSPTKAPSSSSTSAVCVDTPEWKDVRGCPDTDKYAGEMGPPSENCCHCRNRSCEDFMAKCQEDTILFFPDNDGLASVCKETESSCCEVADHNVKIVTNVLMGFNETVGLYHECKCDFWLRLCEDLRGGEACDYAAEYCCGDYKYESGDLVYTNSPTCYCDFFNYAQNEFGHKLKTKTKVLNVIEEIRNPCGQVKNGIRAFIDINGADGLRGVERSSLEAIYNKTYGQNWTNNARWMNETVDHCEWHGIACDGDGFVTSIDLRDNNLAGQFPVYSRNEIDGRLYLESHWAFTKYGLANLFYLKTLDLANNKLT
eukprot:scaffold6896_cov82-Skeletonema_menzelii.AAC.1